MKKMIVAIDSFKGCLTSHEANDAVGKALKRLEPDADVRLFDVSDGGEGFLAAMRPERIVQVHVHDAMMRWIDARFGVRGDVGIIESAEAVGLARIEPELRNPLRATSYGVGELMVRAWQTGCRRFVVGLGGTATSDCGLGMLRCLGHAAKLNRHLPLSAPFDPSWFRNIEVTLASDVRNPLLGNDGAAHVFGPQKGATPEMVELLERRGRTFAEAAAKKMHRDMSMEPGAGAAGGLGYAFMQFFDARMESGARLVLKASGFDDALQGADLVITGEGSADRQTLMGKLPSMVLQAAQAKGIPVMLMAGRLADVDRLRSAGFAGVININDGQSSAENPLDRVVAEKRLAEAVERMSKAR